MTKEQIEMKKREKEAMLAAANVPVKQLKVIEQFKISLQSNMSSWK